LQNNIITTVWEAKMDLLSEQRPLSHKLIAICLGGMSLPVEQDKDGDFRLNLSKFNVTAWVCPTLPTELRILCIYNNAVPTGKRETALCFCDVFNQKTNMVMLIFKTQMTRKLSSPMSFGGILKTGLPALISSLRM
jgi:hypothetical protein